jgi:regulator of RNase E activity RraA
MNTLRIFGRRPQITAELVARFRDVPSSVLSDALDHEGGAIGIRYLGGGEEVMRDRSIAGTVVTVRTAPGDNLAVHKAIDIARPGDVIVVDVGGDLKAAVMGELVARYAASRKVAAIVVDGVVRDRSTFSSGELPVFARGICHVGPGKVGPGEIHGSVCVGGIVVSDGDLFVGDIDGVTFVPAARVEQSLSDAGAVLAKEAASRRAIEAGTWDRAWVDAACRIVESADVEVRGG